MPEQVDLSLHPVRILVAVSFTVCRELNDFQPGRPMGVGRLYPHVMVVATAKLDRVEAGVRLARPHETTLLDAEQCGCGEMTPEIRGLLVVDSNKDAMVLESPLPFTYWANLFNYYVTDPALDPQMKGKAIPIVRRSKPNARSEVGLVERDCSDIAGIHNDQNVRRVAKQRRQGQFDNIHLAPRMKVTDKIDLVRVGEDAAPFTSNSDWYMDRVVMAPFCPHDCLHMHWRWGDNANDEKATYGWGPEVPYEKVGRVMIPENQDASLVILSHCSVTYLAQAYETKPDKWDVFCHHGLGYSLSSSNLLEVARQVMATMQEAKFYRKVSTPLGPTEEQVIGGWALGFWRLRFAFHRTQVPGADGRLRTLLEIRERFAFTDRSRALNL